VTWLINPFQFGLPPFAIPSALYWRCRALRHPTNTDWIMGEMALAATPGGATLCTGGTAIASGGSPAANAFDGSLVTYWKAQFVANSWVGYRFTTPVSPQELRITYPTTTVGQYPIALSLDYSANGVTWFMFAAFDDTTWVNSQTRSWSFNPVLPNSSTQWRMYMEFNTSGTSLLINVAEFQMASSIGGANQLTGGTPTGNVAAGAGSAITNAFDGNPATMARWTGQYRSICTYTTASALVAKELRAQGSVAVGGDNPGDLRLQLPDGSGGAWRVAAALTGIAPWTSSEWKSVVVS